MTSSATARVSCGEYSFPDVPGHANRIGIVKLLGFDAVDIGLFIESDADLAAGLADRVRVLDTALEMHELRGTDLFFTCGATFEEIAPNQRNLGDREHRRRQFAAAAALAEALEIPGLTILPGVAWPEAAGIGWDVCLDELRWRVEEAARRRVSVGFEPHIGSIASTPELALSLLEAVPGLGVTLDLSHFDVQAIPVERALALAPHARHVHVRASRPGAIQVRWEQNEAEIGALVGALATAGYEGCFCVEYVPMPKWRCDEVDVVGESLRTRAALAELGLR